MKHLISSFLRVKIVDSHEIFLGLPTLARRNRSQMFSHVRETLWKTLHRWNSKLLSTAGKEVLIKAIAQVLPTYTMAVFQVPQSQAMGYDC